MAHRDPLGHGAARGCCVPPTDRAPHPLSRALRARRMTAPKVPVVAQYERTVRDLGRSEHILIDSWWMVLDRAQERIVCRTTSPLEAFRVARRRTGGSVK